ncbi:MAG: hypothetical protein FWD53_10445, partial [Phycisphaerales bacterium]|nr:hypothetical protein [Phycisphaerales bacterium]
QVGWIYVSKEAALKNWNLDASGSWDSPIHYTHDSTTKTLRERTIEVLQSEVSIYDDYLQERCYGVCVEVFDTDGCSLERDASWGYFGNDHAEKCMEESVDSIVTHLTKK